MNLEVVCECASEQVCGHLCSGNCRRVGCNCICGEWHEYPEEVREQEAIDYQNENQKYGN